MTARDQYKPSDTRRGPKRTPPKAWREEEKKELPAVSDHAVLRYIERVLGVDVEALRLTMLTPAQLKLIANMREGEVPIGGGHYARIRKGRVVTLL